MSQDTSLPTSDELEQQLAFSIALYQLQLNQQGSKVSGSLQYGIELDGQFEYDFEMRLPTVRDDMAIPDDVTEQERILHLYAPTVTFGGRAVSVDDLAGMSAQDFDALYAAQRVLKKKRLRAGKV